MKRLIAFIFVLTFLLSFGGCGNTKDRKKDITANPADTAFPIAESPTDGYSGEANKEIDASEDPAAAVPPVTEASGSGTPVGAAKEIESITDNTPSAELPCVEEPFFEDASYTYLFGYPISRYVIVKYTDGSTENVKVALKNGHIQITDLDQYNISYFAEPKHIETIVDLTKSGELATDDALEGFFRDERYVYIFPSIMSQYITVYYKDGTEQNVKEALSEGRIKISDLDWFGIQYDKYPIV